VVGLVQFCANTDVQRNLEKCAQLIEECAEKGAQMVCLPEHFAFMSDETVKSGGKKYEFNELLDRKLFRAYCQLALDN